MCVCVPFNLAVQRLCGVSVGAALSHVLGAQQGSTVVLHLSLPDWEETTERLVDQFTFASCLLVWWRQCSKNTKEKLWRHHFAFSSVQAGKRSCDFHWYGFYRTIIKRHFLYLSWIKFYSITQKQLQHRKTFEHSNLDNSTSG